MDIFESLENLEISEECFDEIMGIVEEYINELKDSTVGSMYQKRKEIEKKADEKAHYADTVGQTALAKAKKEKDTEKQKKIKDFIDKSYNDQVNATSKRLKSVNNIKNWARKMRGINVYTDDKGDLYTR